MGNRGPAPTPTPILKLTGSNRVTRKREAAEVRGPEGVPDPPGWMDADARTVWNELVPMLDQMGVLTRIDGHALARYCRVWVRWRKAEEFIDQHGEMYPLKNDSGETKCFQQWPQVAIAHKQALLLTRLEAEFGMTPSARSRIQLAPKTGENARGKARFFEAG